MRSSFPTSAAGGERPVRARSFAAVLWLCLIGGHTTGGTAQGLEPAKDPVSPPAPAAAGKDGAGQDSAGAGGMTMAQFLDRLMMAESGGRLAAKNPRSTALGPYQFIASTWLMISNKHFTKETDGLRVDQVLALRIDLDLSRRAAEIYTQQNAAYLVSQGHKATFANLRLSFLVGPSAAARVLAAEPDTTAGELLGASVILANPFMAKLTAQGLIARAARDIATDVKSLAGLTPDAAAIAAAGSRDGSAKPDAKRPRIAVPCSLSLPSCRRWLALAQNRAAPRVRKERRASR